ncbi:MAG: hypothetical protein HC853_03690 [Anaerolineae bacterium]|nr:hypothetical protein [Anaerolineae bacterium]
METISGALLPLGGVHVPATLHIRHEPVCKLVLNFNAPSPALQVQSVEGGTQIIIPATPACDVTQWVIEHQDGIRLSVSISVARIWWACHSSAEPPTMWGQPNQWITPR